MRIATAVLIVLANSVVGLAQQLAPPPLVVPRRETPPRPLFPVVPDKSWFVPESPPPTTPSRLPLKRSGVVCMKTVPVDPSIDPGFVRSVPDTGLTLRRIEVPPCVTLAAEPHQFQPAPSPELPQR
jgi:hypothetical protein